MELFQINLDTLQPRSNGTPASFTEYQGVLRAYTRGLAESDEVGRAVDILLTMPEPSTEYRWLDRRLAASYLFAFGQAESARVLLRNAPPIEHGVVIQIVAEFLRQPTRVARYDGATFDAFGLDYRDPMEVSRVMGILDETGNPGASRLASRVLELRPGDPAALALLKRYERELPKEVMIPMEQPN